MNYGPTSQLIRGHSEVVLVQLDSLNGAPVPNSLGVEYPLGITHYADREVMEVRCITDEFLKLKGLPTAAQTSRFVLTMKTPEGDAFVKDMPLSRLAWLQPGGSGPVTRNLVFEPRRIDGRQCTIATVGTIFNGIIALELVYRT